MGVQLEHTQGPRNIRLWWDSVGLRSHWLRFKFPTPSLTKLGISSGWGTNEGNRKPTATKAFARYKLIFLSPKRPEEGVQVWCNAPISSQIITLLLSVGTLVPVVQCGSHLPNSKIEGGTKRQGCQARTGLTFTPTAGGLWKESLLAHLSDTASDFIRKHLPSPSWEPQIWFLPQWGCWSPRELGLKERSQMCKSLWESWGSANEEGSLGRDQLLSQISVRLLLNLSKAARATLNQTTPDPHV